MQKRYLLFLGGLLFLFVFLSPPAQAQPRTDRAYTISEQGDVTSQAPAPNSTASSPDLAKKSTVPAYQQSGGSKTLEDAFGSENNVTQRDAASSSNVSGATPGGDLNIPSLSYGKIFKSLAAFCAILALLFIGSHYLRKLRTGIGAKRGHHLQLESNLALGPRKSVAVVRFLNKRLVLGVTDSSITCLHIQEDDDHADSILYSPEDNGPAGGPSAAVASHGDAAQPGAASKEPLADFAAKLKEHL